MEFFSRLCASILLILLSPILILISILCLFLQGSPILFKQIRVGFNYRPFSLYKFRSMLKNNSGSDITQLNDSRITYLGKFIRLFKLDELPQLWNILKGEMRFIGPRPEVEKFVKDYDFTFLYQIKPGLTDFASILLRNEADILSKSGGVEKYPKLLKLKVKLAHIYSKHKNFYLDLTLVCITMISILLPKFATKLVINIFINRYDPSLNSEIREWIND